MMMVGASPSLCLKSGVSRLGQTAEQLNAINGVTQIAPLSFVRSRSRHTGGYIIPFLNLWQPAAAALPIRYISTPLGITMKYAQKGENLSTQTDRKSPEAVAPGDRLILGLQICIRRR